jgi:hypothetical protein
MLREAFGEHSLSWTAVFEWHLRFKASRVSVEDDKRLGRKSTSKTTENVEKIWELINEDRCLKIHELANTIWISYGVCQILTENLNSSTLLLHHYKFLKTTELWLTTTQLSFPILPTHWS